MKGFRSRTWCLCLQSWRRRALPGASHSTWLLGLSVCGRCRGDECSPSAWSVTRAKPGRRLREGQEVVEEEEQVVIQPLCCFIPLCWQRRIPLGAGAEQEFPAPLCLAAGRGLARRAVGCWTGTSSICAHSAINRREGPSPAGEAERGKQDSSWMSWAVARCAARDLETV